MKHLLLKLLALGLVAQALVFAFVEAFPDHYNSPNNARWRYLGQVVRGQRPIGPARLLVLGESRVNAGLRVEHLPGAWSLAAGGSTAIEMCLGFEQFLASHPRPDTVYLSLSPRSLCTIYAYWDLAVRNGFFTPGQVRETLRLADSLDDPLLSFDVFTEQDIEAGRFGPEHLRYVPPRLRWLGFRLNYLAHYQLDIRDNHLFGAAERNRAFAREMDSLHGRRPHPGLLESCALPNYEARFMPRFEPPPLLDHYLRRLLGRCQAEGIHLIFWPSPMNESSRPLLSPDFRSQYATYLRQLAADFPGCDISDSLIFYPDSLFGDPSHLNARGADRFTREVQERFFGPAGQDEAKR